MRAATSRSSRSPPPCRWRSPPPSSSREEGVSAEVLDLRCLVPLDASAVLASVARTSRLVTVEENPYQGGWGATVAALVADEGFELLDAPIRRVAAACVPLPFADALEDQVLPTVGSVVDVVRRLAAY
ncbi:transketolase C-terminal domain-containing protein [Nocardioides panacis]|uniref:transketolase C-terminal domain-containing protein n=1 Tax=Nocardioides panacis TaxID=2849501 RepID=UPI00345EA34E